MTALTPGFGRLLVVACLAGSTAACGDDASTSAPMHASGGSPGAEIGCDRDARAQSYERGLSVPGARGRWTFVLKEAAPAPPAKGSNLWTIAVVAGEALAAEIETLEAVPFMPDHDHGPARAPIVERDGDHFAVDAIDFFMPGLWRVTLTARGAEGTDSAEFFFCVEG